MITIRKLPPFTKSSQSGFTIIESLVAIIVVGILATAIAPVIALSVANRVQARRVEIAADAAKFYVQAIRSGTIEPAVSSINDTRLDEIAAPTSAALDCDNQTYCTAPAADLFCIDGDGDGECTSDSLKDMIIQSAAYHPGAIAGLTDPERTDKLEEGYLLGMRVYRADAFDGNRTLVAGEVASSSTGGTGLRAQQAPLVEMTTEVVTGNTTFGELCASIFLANGGDPADVTGECSTTGGTPTPSPSPSP
ncbi:MAG: type II secretion system protein [Symploca sp. SIO2G7]|nr:type II secretion system protein [Symploca sp. SIO2G7]